MLFTDRDLGVFESDDSRQYFSEILQLYYGKNYRATVVQLYSFVIYDLYCKLQTMANEGDRKAEIQLNQISKMIERGEPYSSIEKSIVDFYKKNCPLYFKSFDDDVEYIRICRNKCAHLKVNDNSLFIPKDYHVAMMISSMYDNIFSVKAPFIMDLFSFVKSEVEYYSSTVERISKKGPDNSIIESIRSKYLQRLTYDSLLKSYCTFFKLLFISNDENCEKNIRGLFAFLYSMTDYANKQGYERLFKEPEVINKINSIHIDLLRGDRLKALGALMLSFPTVMDSVSDNETVFEKVSEFVLQRPEGLRYYRSFNPRSNTTVFEYFTEHDSLKENLRITTLYEALKTDEKFSLVSFLVEMASAIPSYNGFYDADSFMSFFIEHLSELEIDEIDEVLGICINKQQCKARDNFKKELETIREYKEKKMSEDTNITEETEGE